MSSIKEENLINILPKDGPTFREVKKYLYHKKMTKTYDLLKWAQQGKAHSAGGPWAQQGMAQRPGPGTNCAQKGKA